MHRSESPTCDPSERAPQIAICSPCVHTLAASSRLVAPLGLVATPFAQVKELAGAMRTEQYNMLLVDLSACSDVEATSVLDQLFQQAAPWTQLLVALRMEQIQVATTITWGSEFDFILKPYEERELHARIVALRSSGTAYDKANPQIFGYFEFCPMEQAVRVAGTLVHLSNVEYRLALYLFNRAGQTQSRAALYRNVWGDSKDTSARSLDVYISRLRVKLMIGPKLGCRLRSVYKEGYRLDYAEPSTDFETMKWSRNRTVDAEAGIRIRRGLREERAFRR